MLEFGLTGGIGSGKSTVSGLLIAHGATVIDADAIVRDLQRPNELVFDAMVDRWGQQIVQQDGGSAGELDRAAVADIVFNSQDELAALNAIVHPAVADETARRVEELAHTGAVVVHDIPLLVWPGGEVLTSRDHTQWAGIVVIDSPEELAISRVMASRGMERADIVARMDAQATRDERRAVADFVIDNSGSLADLEAEVTRCWAWMQAQQAGLDGPSAVDGNSEPNHDADAAVATPAAHNKNAGLDGPSAAEGPA